MEQLEKRIRKWARHVERTLQELPEDIGIMATNEFDRNFERQGFFGQAWPEVARRKSGEGTQSSQNRNILVDTGRLRRSIRHEVRGDEVRIFSDAPYAGIHNEGGEVSATQNVRAHSRRHFRTGKRHGVRGHSRKVRFTIPRRRFIGDHPTLNRRIKALIARKFKQPNRR